MVNCPGKKGADVLGVCERQWARLGCYTVDCVSGTGDGGGENEGVAGVHGLLENVRDDYVRRRCLAHLPWRVADQGLAECEELHDATKAISSYLHEGVTWNRLKALAVTSVADGGLALFGDGSPQFHEVFGRAPPKNMDERPDTTCALLKWLIHRQVILARLVRHDALTRHLGGQSNTLARNSLCDIGDCVRRRVLFVMLKKALYVYYFIEGHENVVLHTSLADLVNKAKQIMTSTRCDNRVLEFLGHSPQEVANALGDITGKHWVDVAVDMTPDLPLGDRDALKEQIGEFYAAVVMRMQSHFSLIASTLLRSTWLAARTYQYPIACPMSFKHVSTQSFAQLRHNAQLG